MSLNEDVTTKDARQVDASQSEDLLWLVKFPNYLYEEWCSGPDYATVAKIIVPEKSGEKSNNTFILACNPEHIKKDNVPTVNNFTFLNALNKDQKEKDLSIGSRDDRIQALMTEEIRDPGGDSSEEPRKTQSFVGKVIVRCNVAPPNDMSYFAMKSQHIKAKNVPDKVCKKHEESNKPDFKPKTTGTIKSRRNAIKQDVRVRVEKSELVDKICALFEKHQYYNIKDIVSLLNQPIAHVKDGLKEVAQISNQPSRRHMWELKPEYRFYAKPTD